MLNGDDSAALSSEATFGDRRPFMAEPREDGRCCHERVFDREGAIAALEGLFAENEGLGSGCGTFFSMRASCLWLNDPAMCSADCMLFCTRDFPTGGSCGVLLGEMFASCMDVSKVERMEWGVPALDTESLVGDRDLARSLKVN